EGLGGDRIGERRRRAPGIDRRLRALGLELVQDLGELGHLRFVELELVREETKRSTDTEASAELAVVLAAGPRALPGPSASVGWPARVLTARPVTARMLPPSNHSRMHFFLQLPGLSLPAGSTRGRHCLARYSA